jgi:threonine dehydrogenase-like Zn-dependent dehydrogenase
MYLTEGTETQRKAFFFWFVRNVGIVDKSENRGQKSEMGNRRSKWTQGEGVVCNGPHAEVVSVAASMCAKVPDVVSDEEATFAVLGAVALQGIRLASPTLGETFVVTGLGLIGQLAVQLLLAHGCRVMAVDFDSWKCDLARSFGAETVDLSKGGDPLTAATSFSKGRGVDGVIITASTKSSEPVHQAAQMCRKRGRIVLVGVTGLELSRADFYEKELSFQVSCSYGPGRYDPEYEEKGHDYQLGYARWRAQRNFEAVLDMMAAGKINMKPLITHRFPFEEAEKAYELISENREPYLGIILQYNSDPQITRITQIQ